MKDVKTDIPNNGETREASIGEVKDVIISLVKLDNDLISKIVSKMGMDTLPGYDYVKRRMRYNVWTVDQFCELTSKSVPNITILTKKIVMQGTAPSAALNYCYPMEGKTKGPKFIYRNVKSIAYLLNCL